MTPQKFTAAVDSERMPQILAARIPAGYWALCLWPNNPAFPVDEIDAVLGIGDACVRKQFRLEFSPDGDMLTVWARGNHPDYASDWVRDRVWVHCLIAPDDPRSDDLLALYTAARLTIGEGGGVWDMTTLPPWLLALAHDKELVT